MGDVLSHPTRQFRLPGEVMKKALLILLTFVLVGCTTVYRDRFTALELDQNATRTYDVDPPPTSSSDYANLLWQEKESLWVTYTSSLIEVIGKYQADKAGLVKADDEFKKKVEELNKKAVAK